MLQTVFNESKTDDTDAHGLMFEPRAQATSKRSAGANGLACVPARSETSSELKKEEDAQSWACVHEYLKVVH